MSDLTAKEFERKYWLDNNPITTPLWKCLDAYYNYKQRQANEANKQPEEALNIGCVSHSYLELMRQWFNAVQDLNPDYLKTDDYKLANEIYQTLGYRTPDSIFDNCG